MINYLRRALRAPFELVLLFADDWGDNTPTPAESLQAFKHRHHITTGRVGRTWFAERLNRSPRIAEGATELEAVRAYCQQEGVACDL